MRKIPFLFIPILVSALQTVNAQTYIKYWDKTYGGNASDMAGTVQYSGSKIFLSGHSETDVNGDKTQPLCYPQLVAERDMWFLIIDTSLNIISQHDYGGKDFETFAYSGFANLSQNILVCCESYSDSSCDKTEDNRGVPYDDYWICYLDTSGNIKWDKTLGGVKSESSTEIIQLTTGDIVISGQSFFSAIGGDKSATGYGGYDFWAVKLDTSGKKLWDKVYGSTGNNTFRSIASCAAGNFILGGSVVGPPNNDVTDTSMGLDDVWIILLDSAGNKIWDQRYGGSQSDQCYHIRTTSDGFVLCGKTNSPQSGDVSDVPRGALDYWILKLDSLGNKQWDKRYGGAQQDIALWIEQSQDGGYWVGGYTESDTSIDISEYSYGTYDYWVLKLDSLGNKIWDKRFGGPGADYLSNFLTMPDGSLILFGSAETGISAVKTDSGKGDFDYWLVRFKYSESGVGFNETSAGNNQIIVTPNPVINFMQVTAVYSDEEFEVGIFDLSGREILRKEFSRQVTVPVQHLSPGMYFYKVTGSNGKTEKGKIVKQ